ncbi:hypothetical protein Hanom_Chr10g00947541 [Helianthus anomalus]
MNECSRTQLNEPRPLFIFVHLTNRTEFLVHVRSFIKRTNINELPTELCTERSVRLQP